MIQLLLTIVSLLRTIYFVWKTFKRADPRADQVAPHGVGPWMSAPNAQTGGWSGAEARSWTDTFSWRVVEDGDRGGSTSVVVVEDEAAVVS